MRYVIVLFCLVVLAACGSKTRVILLPDDEGHSGRVIVKNQETQTTLDTPYTYADVTSRTSTVEAGPIDRDRINQRFERLLKAEPPKPVHFTLYFESGTTTLTAASLELIPRVIEMAAQRAPSQISVIGHTDTMGSAAHNIRLSMERARVVAADLESSGVEMKTISVTSHGENELLIPTEDNVSEPRNRRVEIMVR